MSCIDVHSLQIQLECGEWCELTRDDTLIHPCQTEGLRVLEICYKELFTISVAYRGDTRGPKYSPKTTITVEDEKRGATSYQVHYSTTPKKSVTRTNSHVE